MMSLALIMPGRDTTALAAALAEQGIHDLAVWPDPAALAAELAVVWRQPPGVLGDMPDLRAVMSLGAGVDFIVDDASLAEDVPVCRVAGNGLARRMAAYLVGAVVHDCRNFARYRSDQAARRWAPEAANREPRIGFLGGGATASGAIDVFVQLGFEVAVWTRRGATSNSAATACSGADGLAHVAQTDYLICLLPKTEATIGILGNELFSYTKPTTTLINVARGELLDENALLRALDEGRLQQAWLDVFASEPLPSTHPFWAHPSIRITPHVSALTPPGFAAQCIAATMQALQRGDPLPHQIDRRHGY